ncbi:hypothetical protein PRUPE_4G104200 [Prunus persica]|uniref:Uncharacterized protein n=1 Tax=Prunus persica TaxID=3760 RepID=A0A251PIJ0_PRUPE|nr:hypothetical protein PRUPE_4G104200 [Prunus persica]
MFLTNSRVQQISSSMVSKLHQWNILSNTSHATSLLADTTSKISCLVPNKQPPGHIVVCRSIAQHDHNHQFQSTTYCFLRGFENEQFSISNWSWG